MTFPFSPGGSGPECYCKGLKLECRVSILSIILCNWLCKWILNEFDVEAYSGDGRMKRKRVDIDDEF